MLSYLRCIRTHRGTNDAECRNLSKSYLSCRMDRYVPDLPSFQSSLSPATSIFFLPRRLHSFVNSREKRGACHTELSKLSDQVVGNFRAWSCSEARGRCTSPHSLSLVRSETFGLSIRSFSTSPFSHYFGCCTLWDNRSFNDTHFSTSRRHTASAASEQSLSLPWTDLQRQHTDSSVSTEI